LTQQNDIASRELTYGELAKRKIIDSTMPARWGYVIIPRLVKPLRFFLPQGSSLLKNAYFEDPKKTPL